MYEKITLDMLTIDSVSVKRQQYTEIGGIEYAIGSPHRISYVNSIAGRAAVEIEQPQVQQNAIFAIWGSEPTVI